MKNQTKHFFRLFLALFLGITQLASAASNEYTVNSPGGKVLVVVTTINEVAYSVYYENKIILLPSTLSMTLDNGIILGGSDKVQKVHNDEVKRKIIAVVPHKNREIEDHYSELKLDFRGGYSLIFRAYDDGIAYRFETRFKGEITVVNEEVTYQFPENHFLYFPEEESFFSHNEREYLYLSLSEIGEDRFASLPLLVYPEKTPKIGISESDLEDYPGMWIKGAVGNKLAGIFPAFALKEELRNDRHAPVVERAGYLAVTNGTRSFPWRAMLIAEQDGDLVENDLIFKLAKPNQLKETDWIKPGKVAWDWWNYNNIYGVDFQAGVNTETYKYYIDFAARHGIEYIILDEGWYPLGNLLQTVPEIDMPQLLSYAEEKNVGIILWVIWKTLDDQLNEAMDLFEGWGVKGLKVDFMQRDDQWMVNYYYKIAREAAKRNMLVDFHGAYKPSGLRRTYPNVLTREGLIGLEHSKWSEKANPEHNLTIPYIRMFAGPMDYTPGAMLNTQQENFHPIFNKPMGLGTRVHQMAMYVVYESPLQMLSDNPSNYLREEECLEFISKIPVVWDKTIVLDGKVSDYILIARKQNDEWYIGAMTDWDQRSLSLDLSFLDKGDYEVEIFRDGQNASRSANDYKKEIFLVSSDSVLEIKMARGGGWVAHAKKK